MKEGRNGGTITLAVSKTISSPCCRRWNGRNDGPLRCLRTMRRCDEEPAQQAVECSPWRGVSRAWGIGVTNLPSLRSRRQRHMSYTNLLYHIVYATKERAPLITHALRPRLHEHLGGTLRGLGRPAIEINATKRHVPILPKLRPPISVSEFLSKLNSGSLLWREP